LRYTLRNHGVVDDAIFAAFDAKMVPRLRVTDRETTTDRDTGAKSGVCDCLVAGCDGGVVGVGRIDTSTG